MRALNQFHQMCLGVDPARVLSSINVTSLEVKGLLRLHAPRELAGPLQPALMLAVSSAGPEDLHLQPQGHVSTEHTPAKS